VTYDEHPRRAARRRLLVLALVLALVAVGSFVAGRSFSTPASEAAKVAPPDLSRITAPVERRRIRDATPLTCTPKITERPLRWAGGGGMAVVTSVSDDLAGSIPAGWVPLYVQDRPIVVLPGRLPVYRSLRTGARGSDVLQLQDALAAAGYPTGERGRMGAGTVRALRSLYTHLGAPPPIRTSGRGKKATITIDQGEFVFVDRLRADTVRIAATVGQVLEPGKPFATATTRTASLSCRGAAAVGAGLRVEVRGAGGTQQCRTAGSTKGKVAVRCSRPTRGRPTAELVRAQSSGAVLAVPSTAVVVRGAQTVVRVATGDTVREVPVTVGVAGGGYAAVSSTALSAGDEVVVGEREADPA